MMWNDQYTKRIEDLKTKTFEAFFQYVLLNESIDERRIEQYCQALQLNYTSKYFCIVINIGNSLIESYDGDKRPFFVNDLKESLLENVQSLLAKGKDDIFAFLNLEKIVVLKAIRSDDAYFKIMEQFEEKSSK